MIKNYDWKRFIFKNGRVMEGFLFKSRLLLADGSTIGYSAENVVDVVDIEVSDPILRGKLAYIYRYSIRHGIQEAIRKWKLLTAEDTIISDQAFSNEVRGIFNGLGYNVSKMQIEDGCMAGIEISKMEMASRDIIEKSTSYDNRNMFMRHVRKELANKGAINFDFSDIEQIMDYANNTIVHMVRIYTNTVMTKRGLESLVEDSRKYVKYGAKGILEAQSR